MSRIALFVFALSLIVAAPQPAVAYERVSADQWSVSIATEGGEMRLNVHYDLEGDDVRAGQLSGFLYKNPTLASQILAKVGPEYAMSGSQLSKNEYAAQRLLEVIAEEYGDLVVEIRMDVAKADRLRWAPHVSDLMDVPDAPRSAWYEPLPPEEKEAAVLIGTMNSSTSSCMTTQCGTGSLGCSGGAYCGGSDCPIGCEPPCKNCTSIIVTPDDDDIAGGGDDILDFLLNRK